MSRSGGLWVDSFLEQLAKRLQVYDADKVTADETKDWPDGKLNELIEAGILTEIEPAKEIVCDQCEENCDIEPEIRENPATGKNIGVFVCSRRDDIGRVPIDLNRLRQWQIDKKKLWKLVYGFESEWQVPWNDNNGEYISLQEAVNLANNDSITVKNMSRLLEDPEFPVRRMHKGRRCAVHIDDFRKWLQYAQHGKITDNAIEKYLNGAEKRKKATRKKKTRP
ncbi:MAG: hypothetical protein NTX52_13340 [Planctomycetota bacterium]|nr:hypothetical protein [Planctomycetota bacterium]